jgi:hypothetical protein
MSVHFGTFNKDGKTFRCVFDPADRNRKGYLVRYWKDNPNATSFFRAPNECRVKVVQKSSASKESKMDSRARSFEEVHDAIISFERKCEERGEEFDAEQFMSESGVTPEEYIKYVRFLDDADIIERRRRGWKE